MHSNMQYAPVRVNPIREHPLELRYKISGRWQFVLDPADCGLDQEWFHPRNELVFTDCITVPGFWQGQGFGRIEEKVIDFGITARTYRAAYEGTGWYARWFETPKDWQGKTIQLNFGGAHPTAEVWVNGVPVGENHFPFIPFGFDITKLISFEEPNYIAVRVSEQDRVMGYAYNCRDSWSGLYRDVEICAAGKYSFNRVGLYPDAKSGELGVNLDLNGNFSAHVDLQLRMKIRNACTGDIILEDERKCKTRENAFTIQIKSPLRWSPDSPNLYNCELELYHDDDIKDALSERFGFTSLAAKENQFLINEEPYYMRGTGDFLNNPELGSGCPDTNRERWRKKLRTLRDYGYNYVRCQSYAPSPEYLDIADEVGLLVQSEMGMLGAWAGTQQKMHVNKWPQPIAEFRDRLTFQWNLTVERDMNHVSANIYCMSNELLNTNFPRTAWNCYHTTKHMKPTAFVLWTDGGYREDLPGDFVNDLVDDEHRIDEQTSKPVIQHEFKWWSSFPDVCNLDKYTGGELPYPQKAAIKAAAEHGIVHILPQAVKNSQKLQFIEAKEKMELCRRKYPRLAGICHFNAMDCPNSPQGIVDQFYDKKYIDDETWLQTNGDTVIMQDLHFSQRVFTGKEELRCTFFVSDFSHPPFRNPVCNWSLMSGNDYLANGQLKFAHTPFQTIPIGEINVKLPLLKNPAQLKLAVELKEADRLFKNNWRIWVFPPSDEIPADVKRYKDSRSGFCPMLDVLQPVDNLDSNNRKFIITEVLDDTVVEYMKSGGRVLLTAGEGLVFAFDARPPAEQEGHYFFTPAAQFAPFENGHNGTIIRQNPIFNGFPHSGFADYQFYRLMAEHPAMDIGSLGLRGLEPIIRAVHKYPIGRSLSYLFEVKVGNGGMLVSSLNLDPGLPEARYLFRNMCRYLKSSEFNPAASIDSIVLDKLVRFSQV